MYMTVPLGLGDHPRSRGVYSSHRLCLAHHAGSSPLARGLLTPLRATPKAERIIPARAGFTAKLRRAGNGGWDHPRSRGVYSSLPYPHRPRGGSSPLARGLQTIFRVFRCGVGIIPARAGFTVRGSADGGHARDHPRSRGVYAYMRGKVQGVDGSSPLARGLLTSDWYSFNESRIIPARAGFTHAPSNTPLPHQDHPRSRGVYSRRSKAPSTTSGSSPLARGLRGQDRLRRASGGIIPARAGFTSSSP